MYTFFHFFDLMSVKIKGKNTAEPSSVGSSGDVVYSESMTSVYRYSGFAIHSMIEKRKKFGDVKRNEVEVLESMICKHDESYAVPKQVRDFDYGNLCIPLAKIIPFIQLLLQKIMSNICDKQLKVQGHK